MSEQVILVDQQDQVIGQAEKIEAHRRGLLHRAFSIFIFRHEFRNCETRSLNISPARSKFAHGDSRGRIPILPLENPPSGKVFHTAGEYELLLQQRQFDKYHCGGLWSNTCCGHPCVDEEVIVAGERRLQEEMGIKIKLRNQAVFHYLIKLDNDMIENEMDHVLVGDYNEEEIKVNPVEVADYCWMRLSELRANLISCRDKYTPWLTQAFSLTGRNA
jgi:diphosphomevalonate decarboxylase